MRAYQVLHELQELEDGFTVLKTPAGTYSCVEGRNQVTAERLNEVVAYLRKIGTIDVRQFSDFNLHFGLTSRYSAKKTPDEFPECEDPHVLRRDVRVAALTKSIESIDDGQ